MSNTPQDDYDEYTKEHIWDRWETLRKRVTPSEASRTVNSFDIVLPKDDERTTMITKAIADTAFDLSLPRHETDREFVKAHRPAYAELSKHIGKDETEYFEYFSKIADTVETKYVGPNTQARNLTRVILFSHLDKTPSLPQNSPIGDFPGYNQWPPFSEAFYSHMVGKYETETARLFKGVRQSASTDIEKLCEERSALASEIQELCQEFVFKPEGTMRNIQPDSSKW